MVRQFKPSPEAEKRRQEDERRQRERFEQQRQMELSQSWRRAGVPGRFLKPLELAAQPKRMARRIYSALGDGIIGFVCGPHGTGKTRMCIEILRASHWRDGRRVRYTTGAGLIAELQQAARQDGQAENAAMHLLIKRLDLLVIDEVEKRRDTESGRFLLERVIRERYEHGVDTLIVSNLRPDQIEIVIGAAACARITGPTTYICEWKSFRPPSLLDSPTPT